MVASSLETPRDRALRAVVAVALSDGLADKSLRAIAGACGISSRMLIHYFGSKEAMLVEIIRTVEDQQRAVLASFEAEATFESGLPGMRFWHHLRQAKLDGQERLFFEVYGQALQGRPWATPLLEGIVDDWVGPLTEMLLRTGVPRETAAVDARLALAVCRGLLLDVLATGDEDAADAAMARFAQILSQGEPRP